MVRQELCTNPKYKAKLNVKYVLDTNVKIANFLLHNYDALCLP